MLSDSQSGQEFTLTIEAKKPPGTALRTVLLCACLELLSSSISTTTVSSPTIAAATIAVSTVAAIAAVVVTPAVSW